MTAQGVDLLALLSASPLLWISLPGKSWNFIVVCDSELNLLALAPSFSMIMILRTCALSFSWVLRFAGSSWSWWKMYYLEVEGNCQLRFTHVTGTPCITQAGCVDWVPQSNQCQLRQASRSHGIIELRELRISVVVWHHEHWTLS